MLFLSDARAERVPKLAPTDYDLLRTSTVSLPPFSSFRHLKEKKRSHFFLAAASTGIVEQ